MARDRLVSLKLEPGGRVDGLPSNNDRPSFGPLLRRYRLSAGLSQEALAERAGLSADAVSMLERGVRRMPYEQTIENLAAALKLGQNDREKLSSAVLRRRAPRAGRSFPLHSRLPRPLTPLVGRKHDLALVASWFAPGGPRLITITGAGGVGKTRFALELAHGLCGQFDDAVVFVNLTALRDPANIASTILA